MRNAVQTMPFACRDLPQAKKMRHLRIGTSFTERSGRYFAAAHINRYSIFLSCWCCSDIRQQDHSLPVDCCILWLVQQPEKDIFPGLQVLGRKIGTHMFQHLFAMAQLERGMPIVMLSRYLGHASVQITLGFFSHRVAELSDVLSYVEDIV